MFGWNLESYQLDQQEQQGPYRKHVHKVTSVSDMKAPISPIHTYTLTPIIK